MKMNKIIILFFGIVPQIIFAQIADHQDVTLPTPSIISSNANYGIEGSSLAYGMAGPSITLFTIQVGDISVPITLSHSYNGYKPNELPGVLGLGWTISGGGAIIKNVHGKDDDHISGYPKTVETYMSQFSTKSELSNFVASKLSEIGYELNHFKRLIANGSWDGLPDKYAASGPGLSENFFQYRNSMFATFPHSATTISRLSLGNEWLVTNGNGVNYFYGEPNSYTKDGLLDIYLGTNTWQLTKIQSGNGESIEYNYGFFHNETRYQYYDAMRYGRKTGATSIQKDALNTLSFSQYSSRLLESINCPNYKLTYHYSSFTVYPDVGDDINLFQLDSICIIDTKDKNFKTISFTYKKLYNSFFLEEVKIKDQNYKVIENYQFTYNETMSSSFAYPSRNMDHWGYANGNFGYLFPKNIRNMEITGGGDREANSEKSKFGLLNSMLLPTGGSINYEYEKNQVYLGKGIEEFDVPYAALSVTNTVSCSKVIKKQRIVIPYAQEIELHYNCETNGRPLTCDGIGIKIRGMLLTSPTYYSDENITDDKDVLTTVALEAGSYMLEVYSDDKGFEISANITTKDCVKDVNGNCIEVDKFYEVGGHRLKRMSQNPISGSNIVSNIFYHKSGACFESPKYESSSVDVRYVLNGDYIWPILEVTGTWITRSGNSCNSLLREGNPMMYKKVSIENLSDEKVIKNTYEFVHFSNDGECSNGSFYADIPNKRGQVLSQHLYLAGNSEPIKKIENFYKDILPENEKAVIAIHQDFRIAGLNTNDTKYNIGSWCPVNDIKNVLDYSITTLDNVTVKKDFTYNNDGLLESEQYFNSKGEIVNTQYTYSNIFKSKPVLIEQEVNGKIVSGEMFKFNNYGQLIMTSNYYDGIGYIKTKKLIYKTFYNVLDGSIISKPVQQIDYGLENTPKLVISQAWAYNASYPVIKAQNISHFDLDLAISKANIGNYENIDNFLLGVGDFFNDNGSFNIANKEAYASFVKEVQEALPETFITFYTYSPLIGITSITDSNNRTQYYAYDEFGRLAEVRDEDGNILEQHEYNYRDGDLP